jgi:hypothetical protein
LKYHLCAVNYLIPTKWARSGKKIKQIFINAILSLFLSIRLAHINHIRDVAGIDHVGKYDAAHDLCFLINSSTITIHDFFPFLSLFLAAAAINAKFTEFSQELEQVLELPVVT